MGDLVHALGGARRVLVRFGGFVVLVTPSGAARYATI
jgi:hypothetical protein